MEEAEALGTKLAIMVRGQFKCFGTAQEIKERYGMGFSVQIEMNMDAPLAGGDSSIDVEKVAETITQ
jgi:ABC-type multidrug transport system ATPase subunit